MHTHKYIHTPHTSAQERLNSLKVVGAQLTNKTHFYCEKLNSYEHLYILCGHLFPVPPRVLPPMHVHAHTQNVHTHAHAHTHTQHKHTQNIHAYTHTQNVHTHTCTHACKIRAV